MIENDNVVEGIMEVADQYDAVMIGAAGKSIYPQILFGSIPEDIAQKTDSTLIVVKHHNPVKDLIGKVMND